MVGFLAPLTPAAKESNWSNFRRSDSICCQWVLTPRSNCSVYAFLQILRLCPISSILALPSKYANRACDRILTHPPNWLTVNLPRLCAWLWQHLLWTAFLIQALYALIHPISLLSRSSIKDQRATQPTQGMERPQDWFQLAQEQVPQTLSMQVIS